ncbi:MAG: ATP-binding protein [Ferruginibacter sp.]
MMYWHQAGKNWADEYRFMYADGSYRTISDKGFTLYEDNKPTRLIGAIQDITERKKLEAQLLNEQVKKQKLINQATIEAQEKERGMISAELHDNVNQLLMSARLHIGAAKNSEDQNELLDKASEYLLTAVEEIRSLSKRLNTSIVRSVGLEQSIVDVCRNMRQFNDIDVTTNIEQNVIDKLTKEQQLVIFRIIQEQSNNIIKYSRASSASISLTEKNNRCSLVISDDGIGFDKEKQKPTGIGFINIFNRIDAYNGKLEIVTYPDNGCTLNISMPYVV